MKKMFDKIFIEKTNNTKIQFFRYIFVGGISAIINIGSLYIFTEIVNLYYLLSNILGFLLGLITNYVLSKILVFTNEEKFNKIIEFTIYTIIGLIGLELDTLLLWLFTSMGVYYLFSKIISTSLVFIWNFGARKISYIIIRKIKENKKWEKRK